MSTDLFVCGTALPHQANNPYHHQIISLRVQFRQASGTGGGSVESAYSITNIYVNSESATSVCVCWCVVWVRVYVCMYVLIYFQRAAIGSTTTKKHTWHRAGAHSRGNKCQRQQKDYNHTHLGRGRHVPCRWSKCAFMPPSALWWWLCGSGGKVGECGRLQVF